MDRARDGVSRPHRRVLKLAGDRRSPTRRRRRIFDLETTDCRRPRDAHRIGRRAEGEQSVDARRVRRQARPGSTGPRSSSGARLDRASTIHRLASGARSRGIAALVQRVPLDTWRDYLAFHAIDRRPGVLPKAFGDEGFAFYGKTLSGTPQQQRSLEARGRRDQRRARRSGRQDLRAANTFRRRRRRSSRTMVANIIAAFDRRLDALTWMAPKTKAAAPRRSCRR